MNVICRLRFGGVETSYQAGGMVGYTISELTCPLQAFANQIGM